MEVKNPQIWIATSNRGKLDEFRTLLSTLGFDLKSIFDLPVYSIPKETGTTFLENARIKALSLKSIKPEYWVLAEDSGLEAAGLGGLPGIHSARYAGDKASDAENTAKLLKMLKIRSTDRTAKFVCSLVALSPRGEEKVFTGELAGTISPNAKGLSGFGYDSVFLPEGESKTLAELGLAVKNKISHRAQAIRQFSKFLMDSL